MFCYSWNVILGANDISMDSTEEWEERNIEKIYKHPLFDQIPKAAYYDVAVLGKNINIQNSMTVLKQLYLYPGLIFDFFNMASTYYHIQFCIKIL